MLYLDRRGRGTIKYHEYKQFKYLILNIMTIKNENDLYWEVFDYKSYELYYDKVQELMNDEMFNQITKEG